MSKFEEENAKAESVRVRIWDLVRLRRLAGSIPHSYIEMWSFHVGMVRLEDREACFTEEDDVFAAPGFFEDGRCMELEDCGC